MKKAFFLLLLAISVSCINRSDRSVPENVITVSIAPFKYFVDAIADGDFTVNVMVPPGADPHVYEPVPGQIQKLRASAGYISNGYLAFEMVWLERLYETNKGMKKLNLGENIEAIESGHDHDHDHEGHHTEGADPHYWVSPVCALQMALDIRDFLTELNPGGAEKYEENHKKLAGRINELHDKAAKFFEGHAGKPFMIYHPNLAYLARDYGLEEIAVESDGKEPSPAMMRALIDRARAGNINAIFIQREYDTRNARAIAAETGARLIIIDPLAEDWYASTSSIIDALHESLGR